MRKRVNNNKSFKIRVLTGSLAVLMAASNVAATPAFASETPEDPVQIESQIQEEEAYVEEETSVEEEAPLEEEAPAEEEAYAEEEAPVEEETSVEEEAPAEEEVYAEEEAPVEEETSVEEEAPTTEEAPAAKEAQVEESGTIDESATEDTAEADTVETVGTKETTENVDIVDGVARDQLAGAPAEETAVAEVQKEAAAARTEETAETADPEEAAKNVVKTEKKSFTLSYTSKKIIMQVTETNYYENGDVRVIVKKVNKITGLPGYGYYTYEEPVSNTLYKAGELPGDIRWTPEDGKKAAEEKKAEKERKAEEERKAAEEKRAAEIIEQSKKDFEKKLSEMDSDEMMDYWRKISSVNESLANGTYNCEEETEEEKGIRQTLEKLGIDMIKAGLGSGIDKAIDAIPGAKFVGGPVKDLFKKTLGLKKDKADEASLIKQQTQEIKNELDKLQKQLKKDNINSKAFYDYNKALNDYENFVDNRLAEIKDIEKNKDYNDIQKLVRKAFTIGGEEDWLNGDSKVFDLMRDAARVLQGGSTADPEDRSYFDVVYDYHKDSSLFAGEAMQKAEKFINARVQRFMATGSQVMDILGFSRQIAELSDEQVASMDKETRSMYDKIKSAKSAVEMKFQAITDVFNNPVKAADDDTTKKTKGIFETAKDYYAKDKTVYIDKGSKEINLKDQLAVRTGLDYRYVHNKEYAYKKKDDNSYKITCKIKDAVQKDFDDISSLKSSDIDHITEQAKANGMTIKEYLAYCGFDVNSLGNGLLVHNGYRGGHRSCYRGGATGFHIDTNKEDSVKVFDRGKNEKDPWIYDINDKDSHFLFFENE